jgi:heparin binding hemagglutinin HbhA
MSISHDVRSYADLAVAQGKNVLTQAATTVKTTNRRLLSDAPKPAYVALGAADLIAATVTKRVEDLPVDAVSTVNKAQQNGHELITRAQADALTRLAELRKLVDSGVETVTALPSTAKSAGEAYLAAARSATEAYFSTARQVYGSLSNRGEVKAGELRNDPRVAKLLGGVDDAVGSLQQTVAPLATSARSAFDSVNPAATAADLSAPVPARKPAAKKAPAKRASAPRIQAAATKSPTTKSPAKNAATKKATAPEA